MARPLPASEFDEAYYRRFYEDPRTRVASADETRPLVEFVLAYLRFLDVPLESVLDLGCGVGHWQTALASLEPSLSYRGVEHSAFACETYGWERGSAVDYDGPGADLVVCQGVLQYLADDEAERALAQLGELATSALFLEVLTDEDWRTACDRDRSDGAVHRRPAAFYLDRLRATFQRIGGGLFLRRDLGIALFSLEHCE